MPCRLYCVTLSATEPISDLIDVSKHLVRIRDLGDLRVYRFCSPTSRAPALTRCSPSPSPMEAERHQTIIVTTDVTIAVQIPPLRLRGIGDGTPWIIDIDSDVRGGSE